MDTCDSPFRAPQGCRNLSLRILHLAPDTKPLPGAGGRKPFLSSGLPQNEACSTRPHPGAQPVPPRTLSNPISGPRHHSAAHLAKGPGGSSLSRPSHACLRGSPTYQICSKQSPRNSGPHHRSGPEEGVGWRRGLVLLGEPQGKGRGGDKVEARVLG